MNRFNLAFLSLLGMMTWVSPASAQITTTTFDVQQDAYISDGATNTNYGSNDQLWSHYTKGGGGSTQRFFIEFDLSSLPDEAIIVSATLKLKPASITNDGNHPLYIERVDESWSEGTINWSNAVDAYTSDQISIAHSQTTNTTLQEFDVTSHVEQMHWYEHLNHGWRIRLQSESGQQNKGIKYYSSEHATTSWRPQLEVEYILPPTITLAVTHSTNGNDDGSVDATYSGGSNGALNYYWLRRRTETTYTNIESGWYPTNSTIDASSLEPGLYVMTIRDSLYASYPDDKFLFYKWFLVGEEGATTDVTFFNSETYMQDTYIALNKDTVDPANWEDLNYDYKNNIAISTGPPFDGTTYDAIGLAMYECDFDQLLEFTKADFITRPWYKYRANNSSNAMTYRKVSSHWQEDIVTYNTRPSVDSTGTISVAQQASVGTNTDRDTVDILDFIEYWQANPTQNYGMEMSISDLNQAGGAHRQYYDVNFGLASGPLLKLSFTVKEQVVTSFNDTTNFGEITVNAPAGNLPYKYLIGYEPLPILDTLWNVVKDSIPVDSATFYKGNTQSQNFTFSKLPAERYHIAVYDNNGTRILTKEVELRQDIAVYDSTNIEVDNDTLKVAGQATSAQATLFAELPYKENGGIEFEIVSLDDDLIVGFDNSDDAFPTSESDYIYLIEVQTNGKLYFKNDSTIIDSTTVQIGDRVRMVVEDDVVYALKNRSRIGQEDSRSRITKNLKINVELKGKDSKFFVNHLFDHFKIPKFYINPIYPECEAELGQISVGKPAGTYFHSTLTSYTVKDENGNLVESGTSPFTFPVIVDDLGAGIYTVTYFYSIGTIPYTTETYISEEIVIGYPVMWTWTDPEDNITEEVGTMNTIYPTDLADPAYAVSLNKSNPGNNVTDWVQFEPKGFSMIFEVKPYSSTLPAIERIRFSNQEDEKVNEIQITDFGTSILSRYVVVRDENDVIVSTFYGYGSLPFRVSFSDFDEDLSYDNVSVYYNDELETSYAVSPEVEGGQKVRVEMANDASIENTIASFCGEENIPAYADLTKKLDGGYYEAQKGIVRFIYQEEYNDLDGELSYNIYDALNQPIDLSSLDPELSAYGDNRYDLDFSSATGEITLDYGFYILEVQNEKNEKWYLRFRVVN